MQGERDAEQLTPTPLSSPLLLSPALTFLPHLNVLPSFRPTSRGRPGVRLGFHNSLKRWCYTLHEIYMKPKPPRYHHAATYLSELVKHKAIVGIRVSRWCEMSEILKYYQLSDSRFCLNELKADMTRGRPGRARMQEQQIKSRSTPQHRNSAVISLFLAHDQ